MDIDNARQSLIYVRGPRDTSLPRASPLACINREMSYGKFWMGMTMATNPDASSISLPMGNRSSNMNKAGADVGTISEGDKMTCTHGGLMFGDICIIWELYCFGMLVSRLIKSSRRWVFLRSAMVWDLEYRLSRCESKQRFSTTYHDIANDPHNASGLSSDHQVFMLDLMLLTIVWQAPTLAASRDSNCVRGCD